MKLSKAFLKVSLLFKELFTFDLRSLSLMRIGVSFALLIDLFIRLSNLEAHYSDKGILPLEAMFRFGWNENFFSFYTISGSVYIQFFIFAINILCACALLVGYRTRMFGILCWLFIISVHNRNPYIHQGGDDFLRLILFWGIFLPWNSFYSFDRVLNRTKIYSSTSIVSLACFAYLLQVGYVYFFSAILKSSAEWTSDHTAVYYALSLDQIVLPLGKLIYPYPTLLKVITFMVYNIEFYIPLVLIIPFFTSFFRMIFIISILLLHIGITLTLNVGLFPLVGIVSLMGLLPGTISCKFASYIKALLPHNWTLYVKSFFSYKEKITEEGPYRESILIKALLGYFMFFVFNWNLLTIKRENLVEDVRWVGYLFRVDQHWGMFSPGVFKDDGWFIFEAQKKSGKVVDILQKGKEVSYQKLASVSEPFTEDRWRKYSENFLFISNSHIRPYYCSYLLNKWNRGIENDSINSLKIIYMKEVSLPEYKVNGPKREVLCECAISK